ncbi:MAG: membrane dipeptidase [Peptococcaceae bacterium]|nr:membrane dipeptidase [Peptococcaceae bacterium]
MKIFDLHCDTLLKDAGLAGNTGHVDLDRLPEGAGYCQCFALFVHDDYRGQAAADRAEELYGRFVTHMAALPRRIVQCRTTQDIEAALDAGKAAALLTIEGGAALAGEMENLDRMADRGLKMMTLTWNGENEIGGGALSPAGSGLTPFGRDVIRRMEELKVAVDVSHLNDKTFWQVAELAEKPFLATHSNARAICNHPRNLTDDQIREIGGRGGIIGLNYCVRFLAPGGRVENWDPLLQHIDRIIAKGGEGCLALGSDFDGCQTPEFLGGVEALSQFYQRICASGFGRSLADRIFYENAAAFMKNFD